VRTISLRGLCNVRGKPKKRATFRFFIRSPGKGGSHSSFGGEGAAALRAPGGGGEGGGGGGFIPVGDDHCVLKKGKERES